MDIFLVGGALRDSLLNLEIKDRDWVVVGSTPEELLSQGYQAVGKDFPVFLHPKTKEEYALARTERKTGSGYTGFECYFSEDVTLEDDLQRRDLTINAMAQDKEGNIIDPFNGKMDLTNKILRHVSKAFSEDPLRVLRVARFAARFGDFTVAEDTIQLMSEIAESGELSTLTPERVWQEMQRALSENFPWRFFEILRDCGALKKLFPEVDALYGIPNPPKEHPEIDTGIHTMMVLKSASELSPKAEVRFAALCHDFGKALTPEDKWPSHIGHDKSGVPIVEKFCARYKAPKVFLDLAKLATEFHLNLHQAKELTPKTILKILKKVDAIRRSERFEELLFVCEADSKGRKGFETQPYDQHDFWMGVLSAINRVDAKEIIKTKTDNQKIEILIHDAQINALKQYLKD